MGLQPIRHLPHLACVIIASLAMCASIAAQQAADPDYAIEVANPAFAQGEGPRVAIDEAHNNFHTIAGRYGPFAELLGKDGFRVSGLAARFTPDALAATDILVVANALSDENSNRPVLPNHPAFSEVEIAALLDWVENGGSLLLIADHMPWAGAAVSLAEAFGILFSDGFAFPPDGNGRMTFTRADGSLADHPIVSGRDDTEAVTSVMTFTGQAFRVRPGTDARDLLTVADDTLLLMPVQAWRFSEQTPRLSAAGMLQGATLQVGAGRVAVFAEAAMFTAQVSSRGAKMGMNDPEAGDNAQFALNVMHWLSGLM